MAAQIKRVDGTIEEVAPPKSRLPLGDGLLKTDKLLDRFNKLMRNKITPESEVEKPIELLKLNLDGKILPFGYNDAMSVFIGQAKSKKSMAVSLFVSAYLKTMNDESLKSNYTEEQRQKANIGGKVLYIDTEMNEYNVFQTAKRIKEQTGDCYNSGDIDLLIYKGLDPFAKQKEIEEILQVNKELSVIDYRPYRLLVIDGIRDLLTESINDQETAVNVTNWLMRIQKEYNLHIITVIHQNKGDRSGGTARGAIGTELMNKCDDMFEVQVDQEDKSISHINHYLNRGTALPNFSFRFNEERLCCEIIGERIQKPKGKPKQKDLKETNDDFHSKVVLGLISNPMNRIELSNHVRAVASSFGFAENMSMGDNSMRAYIQFLETTDRIEKVFLSPSDEKKNRPRYKAKNEKT